MTLVIATAQACTDYSDIAGRDIVEWGYGATEGPLSWSRLDPSTYFLCGNGTHQSPIDLDDASATTVTSTDYVLDYPALENVPFLGVHHTVQAQVSQVNATNTLTFGGRTYKLLQFHFHVPSEHRIDGEYFPMEVHFVHSTAGK